MTPVSYLTDPLSVAFARAGRDLFLVGGSVRDALLGRPVTDLDFTTDAEPEETKRLVREALPRASIYPVGERFGTIGAACDGHQVEITTYRSEEYEPGSRKPRVRFGHSIEEDISRRDFTINAIAQNTRNGELVDPFGGREDLAARRIRAVGSPADRFREDPLRLLRAIRFRAQLGFAIETATRAAIQAEAASLRQISRERVAQEMNKLLVAPQPSGSIRDLVDLDLMASIIPSFLALRGLGQNASQYGRRYKDVYEHTLAVVDNAPSRLAVRWAALLHDIAKPDRIAVGPSGVNFHGHDVEGAKQTRQILTGLHFSRDFVERVTKLVRMHLWANSYEPDWTDGAVRRFQREVGECLEDLLDLSRADVTSQRPARIRAARERVDALEERCAALEAQAEVAKLRSPLDGNDLMEMFGLRPGPWIGPIKEDLLERVIDGTLAPDDRETAAAIAREHFARLEAAGQIRAARPVS